ncbi:hypothetical protein CALVIDRAFT_478704 [Calocera viscosa TUFC12733]|uniref:CxC1-like cysteine cluster associated with KDZ transposases domain-containing protein n=1 Tax=Calocera viscosa (strain TUFC12733) TaxID=1330018 RepID=A0A167P0H3_CALVF|nr:hypothetical protein CALVIDRAFT_478704 [Calocera viscosa TUFC12733]
MEKAKEHSKGEDRPTRIKVASETLDRCRRAFKVADKDANLVDDQVFDVTGVVILVCRHDVPIFVCDITTPGERQEYAMALIKALMDELPSNATIGVLYDIGCQLDQSCDKFNYLGQDRARITFACSVLHAYGHEWACQVVYNPRRRIGFGLTDGKGSERVWSRTRRLIPILRRANVRDLTMVLSLGSWIKKKYKLIRKHSAQAMEAIRSLGLSETQLREQLAQQRSEPARSSPHTSREVQRKIDLFKKLQTELDRVGAAIQDTVQTMSNEFGWPRSTMAFRLLQEKHEELIVNGQRLLTEMKLDHSFPELAGVSAQFLHYLLLAREEKANIRSRVRDAILKGWGPCWRTTKVAVERYNRYVTQMELIFQPSWKIPLPARLEVEDLQNPTEDHALWQDVWWPTMAQPPLWVTDEKIRKGITAVLLLDRCIEEERRLRLEGDNLERWWMEQMRALISVRRDAEGKRYDQVRKL